MASVDDRRRLLDACRRLAALGLIGATEGNVSLRLDDGTLLTTPTGSNKALLEADALVRVDAAGAVLDGGVPSSELKMHLAVYRVRPEVRAVVHAHPITAVALTLAGLSLEAPLMPEAITFFGGGLRTAPYATPGTPQLAEGAAAALGARHGCLLARHGALTVGTTLEAACDRMEALERLARVAHAVHALGVRPEPLSEAECARLGGF